MVGSTRIASFSSSLAWNVMREVRQTYVSDPRQLSQIRAFVREQCAQAWGTHPNDQAVMHLELALHEATSNIMRHAYQGRKDEAIELVIQAIDDELRVILYHNGREFDPSQAQAPSFDGSQLGGFGLYLIEQCLDEVDYGRADDGRCAVRLVKRRECALRSV